jgi:hypothetical protein
MGNNSEALRQLARSNGMDILFGSEGGESGCIITARRQFILGKEVYYLISNGDSIKCEWGRLLSAHFPTWESAIEFVNRYGKEDLQ